MPIPNMRILMLSKACVVGNYQRKLEEMARLPGVDLTLVVPPSWRLPGGELRLERTYVNGYQMRVEPLRFNGNFHLYYFPTLARCLRDVRPHIVHIDEEPYNLATWQALWLSRRLLPQTRTLFFSWQNLQRRYPFPFNLGETWTLRHIDYAVMGTQNAADVWRSKGYRGPLAVIPQFGIDPQAFQPHPDSDQTLHDPPVIGYVGRLVPEKGVDLLIRALAQTDGRLEIIGQGPARTGLQALAQQLGLAERVTFIGQVPSTELPDLYHHFDVLVVPSRTLPNWKEQFGRIIIEAMACGVPVIGAESGDIPGVIGDSGLLFPEGDVNGLVQQLRCLFQDQTLRQSLILRGRERVLKNYTHAQIARQTIDIYRSLLA